MSSKKYFSLAAKLMVTATLAMFAVGCGDHGPTKPPDVVAPPRDPVAPVAGFGVDRTYGDAPFIVAFTNQSSNATQYRWEFGDGTSSTEASPRHTFTALGRYTVRLTAINSAGNENSTTVQITAHMVVQLFAGTTSYGRYWPAWSRIGDYEFSGHGPDTWMDASLRSNSDGSQLYVDLHMKAREAGGDWSTAEGSWHPVLYNAPRGTRITTLPSDTELHEAFRDNGHAAATTPGNALGYFRWVGDTDGEDIQNRTPDDTHMYFIVRPFPIRLSPR